MLNISYNFKLCRFPTKSKNTFTMYFLNELQLKIWTFSAAKCCVEIMHLKMVSADLCNF